MREETLASVLSGVVRLHAANAPHEANALTCAIAICDECGRTQAKGRRRAVGLAALKMYTFEYPCVYAELNAAMRDNDTVALAPYGRYVSTMFEALLVSPRFEGVTVYRGIKLDMRNVCTKGANLSSGEFSTNQGELGIAGCVQVFGPSVRHVWLAGGFGFFRSHFSPSFIPAFAKQKVVDFT